MRFEDYTEHDKREALKRMRGRLANSSLFQCMCCAQKRFTKEGASVRIFRPRREHKFEGLRIYVICKVCEGALSPSHQYEAVADHFKLLAKELKPEMAPNWVRDRLGEKR